MRSLSGRLFLCLFLFLRRSVLWLVSCVLALLPGLSSGQSPADFFPLHVGDVWEYDNLDIQCDWTIIEVVKDSTIQGKPYCKMQEITSCVGRGYRGDPLWVRVTDSYEVVQYSFHRQSDVLMLRLDASVEDTWEGWDPLSSFDRFYPDNPTMPSVVLLLRGRVRDLHTAYMDFLEERESLFFSVMYGGGIVEDGYLYVEGIGLVELAGQGLAGLALRGAIIDGVPYGTLTVGVEPSSWGWIKSLFMN